MNDKWYYQVMGEIHGPIDFEDLRSLVSSNDIQRETFVRSENDDWVSADRVDGLFPPFRIRSRNGPQWYFRIMGEVRGPVAQSGLRRFAAQNDINRDTFVRCGDGDWVTADRVAGLLR